MIKIAKSYLKQAEARLKNAENALIEENHPYTVRLSQECVELSLKAVLKAVGIEYPKIHDVSDVLIDVEDRFPEWFKKELNFVVQSSKILVKKREISFYGGEEALLSPNEVIGREDAEDALNRARHIYTLCKKLIEEVMSHYD